MVRFGKIFSLYLTIIFLCGARYCSAQADVVPITNVDSMMNKEARPLLILISTDWCKYCQMQKNQLRKNKDFLAHNDSFYYVEFNAESKGTILFHGEEHYGKSKGTTAGIHELAVELNASERISFPTWVVLDREYQIRFRYNGVLPTKELSKLLAAIDEINKVDL